ncbi:MAG: hypothetical protein K2J49_01505 [Muribaculaceae bacterium]|nr:hypothetical protein [Muribaculaceae bacterium]MDE6533471.1 hypothetical protein [Muribaculaceae bacterium]MDE6771255.1 hypothetical protein [Muribaculaceae bacterium]
MQTVYIDLDINEIVYDIQNKTYLTGKSRRDGSNHEKVANMQANDDEENANQVLRSVSMAFSNLKTKLGEYLDLVSTTANNELVDVDAPLRLGLMMPSNYNLSTIDTIAAASHQYIVSMAVADWFTITNKTDSPEYKTLAEVSLQIISEAVNKRTRPVRQRAGKEE